MISGIRSNLSRICVSNSEAAVIGAYISDAAKCTAIGCCFFRDHTASTPDFDYLLPLNEGPQQSGEIRCLLGDSDFGKYDPQISDVKT